MNSGLLISFEGSEGCGKSTQIHRLRARLEARGDTVDLLREPGGTILGEKVCQGYLYLAAEQPDRMVVLDGSQTPEVIEEQIWNLVEDRRHALQS